MIREEYSRFLQTIRNESSEVRKLANIIGNNLDEVVPLTTSQGSRIKKIVELSQLNWDTTSENIDEIVSVEIEENDRIVRLKSLEVGPFRGFTRKEVFDLDKPIVLIYGPNGTGKSSFCEALEYGLLGSVAEADSKRLKGDTYLKNLYTNSFDTPILKAVNKAGNFVDIVADESLYKFCFLEKNRIDSFSRIAAHAPSKQTELISTLFGLDTFNTFVRNFSQVIDERYIEIKDENKTELINKQQSVDSSITFINNHEVKLHEFHNESKLIAEKYRPTYSFDDLKGELYGTEQGEIGLLEKLEKELSQQISAKSNMKSAALELVFSNIKINLEEISKCNKLLELNSKEVSFQTLYSAIKVLKNENLEICPACKTPLNLVNENPYHLAEIELNRLKELATLQKIISDEEKSLKNNFIELATIVNKCNEMFSNNPLESYKLIQVTLADSKWWNSICQKLNDGKFVWEHIRIQVTHLEAQDAVIDNELKLRVEKIAQQNKVKVAHEEIIAFNSKFQSYIDQYNKANKTIGDFIKENHELNIKIELKNPIIERNKSIRKTYEKFIELLNSYKEKLPELLVEDLGELVVRIYNDLNRNDMPSELLSEIKLPTLQNEKLEISFQNQPNKFFDALHLLSEGHIRCIGLSIILAKNIKEDCPILVFDDPVNAIDDEHRENIRLTLFTEELFQNKQIILACHGEEFFKDIQNLLPTKPKKYKCFTFLPRYDDAHINIDFSSTPRNYLENARIKFEKNEMRSCLSHCRQSFELLANTKIWNYVRKNGDGNLNLLHSNSKSPLILRNLVEQLQTKIKKDDFRDPNKTIIIDPLSQILGIGNNTREWTYLNKGTHEENNRPEFSRNVVKTILEALEQIESNI